MIWKYFIIPYNQASSCSPFSISPLNIGGFYFELSINLFMRFVFIFLLITISTFTRILMFFYMVLGWFLTRRFNLMFRKFYLLSLMFVRCIFSMLSSGSLFFSLSLLCSLNNRMLFKSSYSFRIRSLSSLTLFNYTFNSLSVCCNLDGL